MRGALALVMTLLTPLPGTAQDWATHDVCSVDTPAIHDEVFAPSERTTLEAEAAQIPNNTGKFWRITNPDGGISHLWGTYHSADPLILDLPSEVRSTIAASRAVAIEVDYTHTSRETLRAAQMMEGRFIEASDPFAPVQPPNMGLPVEQAEWVRERAIELGWTEDFDLIMSLPGIAEMLLSDPCEDFVQGVLPIQDDYIQLLGRLAGAAIISLEKPNELIADLAASDDTARALIHTYAAYLKPVDSNRERATSFALYLEGRLGMMDAWDYAHQQEVYGQPGLGITGLTDSYLLEFRNKRFLQRLEKAMADGGLFIAVGAAHLPGEAGMVALLRKAGFDVTRIPLPGEAP